MRFPCSSGESNAFFGALQHCFFCHRIWEIADIMLVSLIACCLAREVYHASSIGKARVMLTIHNMDNTGECRQEEFAMAGTG